MSTSTEGFTIPGLVAGADLTAAQYKIAKLTSTAGQVKLAAAATDAIVGVLQNDPDTGEAASVQFGGVAKVAAETGVAIGALVGASSTGRAKTVSSANDQILGKALEASGSAGDLIRVALGLSNL